MLLGWSDRKKRRIIGVGLIGKTEKKKASGVGQADKNKEEMLLGWSDR